MTLSKYVGAGQSIDGKMIVENLWRYAARALEIEEEEAAVTVLPHDLLAEEVLTRLATKSLMRFKSVHVQAMRIDLLVEVAICNVSTHEIVEIPPLVSSFDRHDHYLQLEEHSTTFFYSLEYVCDSEEYKLIRVFSLPGDRESSDLE
ncbi:hypothetical protein RHMOL_Rhmol11G0077800 [Rhododendron molle]|uniref:Uncharacterized protein n=1 Tax=Rhododendron molle TaxID=49168 RepID=A0ACC0LQ58_RHOML|nr:hypothetical protein RHMOL_Rhmol11G0077800 [Rhododendron molle]